MILQAKVHKLKIDQEFWLQVLSGNKNFEVRKDDRNFQAGDFVIFDPVFAGSVVQQTEYVLFKIKYVLRNAKFLEGLKEGYVVFGIEQILKDK